MQDTMMTDFDSVWNRYMGAHVTPAEYAAASWTRAGLAAELRNLWAAGPDALTTDELDQVVDRLATGLAALDQAPDLTAAYAIMAAWDREAVPDHPARTPHEFDLDVPGSLRSEYGDWLRRLAAGDVAAIVEGRAAWGLAVFS